MPDAKPIKAIPEGDKTVETEIKQVSIVSLLILKSLPVPFSILLSGCAPGGLFYWGDYEDSLYQRYIEHNPAQAEIYLQQTIAEAEHNRYRMPPGVYADYGFMLYRRGDKPAAIAYFSKEKETYPESSALMTKLIERVRQQMVDEQEKQAPVTKNGERRDE